MSSQICRVSSRLPPVTTYESAPVNAPVTTDIALMGRNNKFPGPTPTATPTATSSPSAEAEDEPTASPSPTPEPTPDPGPLLTTAKVTKIRVKKGDTVRFRARSSRDEEIHVHGYDLEAEATPDAPAVIELTADLEGVFDVESHTNEALLVKLVVEP